MKKQETFPAFRNRTDRSLAREAEVQSGGALEAVVCQVMEVLRMDIVTGSPEEPHAPLGP